MKKSIIFTCVLSFILVIFYGCMKTPFQQLDSSTVNEITDSNTGKPASKSGVVVAPAGEFPIVDKKITLTAFLAGGNPKTNYNENDFLIWMENLTNINIKITQTAAEKDGETVKQLLLDSGDYPDIFLLDNYSKLSFTQALNYSSRKIIIPINEYYDEYGYYLRKVWEKRPEYKKICTDMNGNIYGFQQITEAPHIMANPKLFVNTEWLQKLGLDMPRTLDEFHDMLRAFKEKDPGGIGKGNVVPMSSHTLCMFGTAVVQSFIPTDMFALPGTGMKMIGKFIAGENGKVIFSADKPEFRNALRYLHGMYEEGLLDPAGFMNNYDQCFRFSSTRTVGVFEVQNLWCLNTEDSYVYDKYRVMPVFSGPTGIKSQATLPMIEWQIGYYAFITERCPYPEAAFRWMDACYDENVTINKWFGKEGLTWGKPDKPTKNILGGEVNVVPLALEKGRKYNSSLAQGPLNGLWEVGSKHRPVVAEDLLYKDSLYIETRSYLDTLLLDDYLMECVPSDMFMENDETLLLSKIRLNICQYIAKSYVEFITGAKDIEKDWDAYLSDLKKLDSEKYVELYQKAYTSFLNVE